MRGLTGGRIRDNGEGGHNVGNVWIGMKEHNVIHGCQYCLRIKGRVGWSALTLLFMYLSSDTQELKGLPRDWGRSIIIDKSYEAQVDEFQ